VAQLRVAIIDDHPAFRAGLKLSFASDPELAVVGDVGESQAGLELAVAHPIDVALVNVLAPSIGGISLVHVLRERRPACAVLGLAASHDVSTIVAILRTGVRGVVLKSQPCDEIASAVHRVAAGVRYLPDTLPHDQIDAALVDVPASFSSLTQREREVFDLLVRGHRNRDICRRLFIAQRTVETHRQRIFKKLSVHSVMQMMRVAAIYGVG